MKYTLINYAKCSTCQKAKRYLKQRNIEFEDRSIIDATPTVDELHYWITKNEIPIRKLFNTSGNLYKEWNLKDTLADMTDDEQVSLLSQHGMLIKRPILVYGDDQVIIGFKEENYAKVCQ